MKHLIIGAGPAGVIAAETLRTQDPEADIVLIGDEPEAPYSRMALPYLLANNVDEAGTYLRPDPAHFQSQRIQVQRGRVASVDTQAHTVTLEQGERLDYDRLLIATGSHTVKPPIPGMDLDGIENCWTLADARAIAQRAQPGQQVVLMGAGFIGCIVLEALVARGVTLTVVEREPRMVPRMMDQTGGELLKRWCESKGVRVLTGTQVDEIKAGPQRLSLAVGNGGVLEADLVVCATGVRPNIGFLQNSGVETDLGILVDDHLRTSARDVYAAGDVAQGPVFNGGQREVHAIQPTAGDHGQVAGLNMANVDTVYGGSLAINVLNTLGLISSSFGQWQGVPGGDSASTLNEEEFKYLRLEFDGDYLVGAIGLGLTQQVGILRGLIQTRVNLGQWKNELLRDPHQIVHAYLECNTSTEAAA